MKKILITSAVLLAFNTAYATDDAVPEVDNGMHMFKYLDVDSNGIVTKDELRMHHQRGHAMMDKDNNGLVDAEEAKAHKRHQHIETYDKDADGHLSYEEGLVQEEERFSHADTDGNGEVTWKEYTKHYSSSKE